MIFSIFTRTTTTLPPSFVEENPFGEIDLLEIELVDDERKQKHQKMLDAYTRAVFGKLEKAKPVLDLGKGSNHIAESIGGPSTKKVHFEDGLSRSMSRVSSREEGSKLLETSSAEELDHPSAATMSQESDILLQFMVDRFVQKYLSATTEGTVLDHLTTDDPPTVGLRLFKTARLSDLARAVIDSSRSDAYRRVFMGMMGIEPERWLEGLKYHVMDDEKVLSMFG